MNVPTDFDLHGIIGIRLIDADAEDAAIVGRQIGLPPSRLAGEPDVAIRFVDRLPAASPLRYVGLDDVGFTDDAFLVLRGKQKSSVRVQIPFDRIGGRLEILCERGLLQVPLLVPILHLTALGKGVLPLHAAAFNHGGAGWVAAGWSKGGKTETLLSFMANGASYVGDEWIYLTGDGSRMVGLPEPIRIWKWHLDHLPQLRGHLNSGDRTRLQALGLLVGGIDRMTSGGSSRESFAARNLRRVKPLLSNQLGVDVPPLDLFGPERCPMSGSPEKLLFVLSHESPQVTVRPIDPVDIAARMVYSLQHEAMHFMSYYWKFRFAFPGKRSELVESSRDIQRDLLDRVVRGKEAFEVRHPYPVAIPLLFEAIRERCSRA